jgi:hypothetical protein
MSDKVELGRRGEIFVMRKLIDNGWAFPLNMDETMNGQDWVFEKNGRRIRIQVKTSKMFLFGLNGNKNFDYLIFTDLKDIYPIPVEMLKVSSRMTKTYKKLKNKFILLEKSKLDLLAETNDCGVYFWELDSILPFFEPPIEINDKRLKLLA